MVFGVFLMKLMLSNQCQQAYNTCYNFKWKFIFICAINYRQGPLDAQLGPYTTQGVHNEIKMENEHFCE
jgi:hypothetical protein